MREVTAVVLSKGVLRPPPVYVQVSGKRKIQTSRLIKVICLRGNQRSENVNLILRAAKNKMKEKGG